MVVNSNIVCIFAEVLIKHLEIMRYFNLKTNQGIETVDCLNPKDFATYKEFRTELARLKGEYRLAGMNVYVSQRATNEYNSK